ncbi:hypothetical protein RJT34_00920 [Clitoria ternatea]|uniref:Uncharacterized protein n=1 Tax=Clitoria ternatea TaxID=43366 RepID=A0AAN9Q0X1_CLITE
MLHLGCRIPFHRDIFWTPLLKIVAQLLIFHIACLFWCRTCCFGQLFCFCMCRKTTYILLQAFFVGFCILELKPTCIEEMVHGDAM